MIQIPVFFALYKVLFITIEMRHAPFFGWIKDLSAPDPTNIFNLFGLIPFDPTVLPMFGHFLHLGVWPIVMGITMFVQMKLNPAPPDPTQKMIFDWMPLIFTFMLASFSAGLVIYWAWNNTLSVLQQAFIMNKHGAKIELWDNVKDLFRKKKDVDTGKKDVAPKDADKPSRSSGAPTARTACRFSIADRRPCGALLLPATAIAKQADGKRDPVSWCIRHIAEVRARVRTDFSPAIASRRRSPSGAIGSPRHGGGDFSRRPALLVRRRHSLRLGLPAIFIAAAGMAAASARAGRRRRSVRCGIAGCE